MLTRFLIGLVILLADSVLAMHTFSRRCKPGNRFQVKLPILVVLPPNCAATTNFTAYYAHNSHLNSSFSSFTVVIGVSIKKITKILRLLIPFSSCNSQTIRPFLFLPCTTCIGHLPSCLLLLDLCSAHPQGRNGHRMTLLVKPALFSGQSPSSQRTTTMALETGLLRLRIVSQLIFCR